MARTFRKQTHEDFTNRIRRSEKAFVKRGGALGAAEAASDRPALFGLLGFVWFYLVLTIATKKSEIIGSLSAGSLSIKSHNYILALFAILIGVSCVLLMFHAVRFAFKARNRGRSGGIVFGALCAMGLVLTPPDAFRAGYNLLDDNTKQIVTSTAGSFGDVDWDKVMMVSSWGQ